MLRRILSPALLVSLFLTAAVEGAPVVFSTSGANISAVAPTVTAFRDALGPLNPNSAGTFVTGRREINWDGVPEPLASPASLPADFFNVTSPRGVILSTPGTSLRVSANVPNPILFSDIELTYATMFTTFSPSRLFTATGTNIVDVTFRVPGSSTVATVTGFGAIFTDVDIASTSSLTFFDLAGNSLGTFFVVPANNGLSFLGVLFDAGERIARVRITSGNGVVAPASADGPGVDVAVLDDFIFGEPSAPVITVTDATTPEGNVAAFNVSLSYPLPIPIALTYSTQDGTAVAGADYTGVAPATPIILPAESLGFTIDVPTLEDTSFEGNENFLVNIALGAGEANAVIGDNQGSGTIEDDDTLPVITIGDVTQAETNAGTTTFTFNVTLSAPGTLPVQVNWTTADGTASAPGDYTSSAGTLPFNPGETARTITVTVSGDAAVEGNETFFVNLTTPVNATIGDAQAVGTITNDDTAPVAAAVPTASDFVLAAFGIMLLLAGVLKLR